MTVSALESRQLKRRDWAIISLFGLDLLQLALFSINHPGLICVFKP